MEPIVNKVAKSGLITIDLQDFEPAIEIISFDIKDFLYMELILKEKEFRAALDEQNWNQYKDKVVALHCSTDAIIAHWAYMLVVSHLDGIAGSIEFGNAEEARERMLLKNCDAHNWSQYQSKKVLLKGCSEKSLPPSVYMQATNHLLPFAERIMYGEACSFVPVHRRKKSPVSST